MNNKLQETVFHITARYVAELQAGLQPSISDYIERYPQHADAIADFAAYYHGIEEGGPETTACTSLSPISQAALTQALQHVSTESPSVEGITTLLIAGQQHFTLPALARKLGLSVDIVALLEQRLIDPSTLPLELYHRIATVLHQSVSNVQAYLSWPSCDDLSDSDHERRRQMKVAERPALYHMSDDQDIVEQSFRHLIAESLWLSPEQRETWEAILTREGL